MIVYFCNEYERQRKMKKNKDGNWFEEFQTNTKLPQHTCQPRFQALSLSPFPPLSPCGENPTVIPGKGETLGSKLHAYILLQSIPVLSRH